MSLIGSFVVLSSVRMCPNSTLYILKCSSFLFNYFHYEFPVKQTFRDPHLGNALWIKEWLARQWKGRRMKWAYKAFCCIAIHQMRLCLCWLIFLVLGRVESRRQYKSVLFFQYWKQLNYDIVDIVYSKASHQNTGAPGKFPTITWSL